MIVTITDVSTRLGRPITDTAEAAQVNAWIDDVIRRIAVRVPTIDTDNIVDPGTVTAIVADVVIRKIKNPDGFRSERIDDYYYDRGGAPADLSLTADEWAQLIPGMASGAFSVRPSFVPDRLSWPL